MSARDVLSVRRFPRLNPSKTPRGSFVHLEHPDVAGLSIAMRGIVIHSLTFSTLGCHIIGKGSLTLGKDLLLRLCCRRS